MEIVKVPRKLKAWIMLISVHFLDRYFSLQEYNSSNFELGVFLLFESFFGVFSNKKHMFFSKLKNNILK
jgi:hypothetical protein